MMKAIMMGLCLLLSSSMPVFARDASLVGTWKLQQFTRETLSTGKSENLYGPHPDGYLSYSSDGRMYTLVVMDNRIVPSGTVPTDQEKIKLYGTMVAYAGTYKVQGDKIIHHVDISWNQNWNGTDVVRFFTLKGDVLTITTEPSPSPIDGTMGRSVLVWKKVK